MEGRSGLRTGLRSGLKAKSFCTGSGVGINSRTLPLDS
jgi:hypothetical protein